MGTAVTIEGAEDARAGRSSAPIGETRGVLARSFYDQPHFVDMFPDAPRRARALPHVFTAVLTDAIVHGRVDTAYVDGELAGVAVWYPPRTYPLTAWRQLRALPAGLRMATAAPRSIPRVMRFQSAALRLHPIQPYAYLAAIGVDPRQQGSGVGTRLLETGLQVADRQGVPCYLETHTRRNVDWYQQHGFRVRASAVAFTPDGPPNWTMLRPPRTAGGEQSVGPPTGRSSVASVDRRLYALACN